MSDTADKAEQLRELAVLRRRIAELEEEAGIDSRSGFDELSTDELQPLRAFQLVADYATDLISVHGPNGDYLFVSSNCRDFFGWERDELIGRNSYDLFHPDDVEDITRNHADHDTGRAGRIRYRLRHKDGDYRWVETRSRARLTDDGVQEIVALTSDIHDQVIAERYRAEADEARVEAAKQTTVARLARVTAHEINNPLTVAIVAAETLAEENGDYSSLHQALLRIKSVVDEFNLLVERGGSNVRTMPLDEILAYLCDLLADDNAYDLETDVCRITAEVGRLHQLLYLALSNHLRSPDRQETRQTDITCRCTDDKVRVEIVGGRSDADTRIRSDILSVLRGVEDLGGSSLALTERLADELGGSASWEVTDRGLETTLVLPRVAGAGSNDADE